MKFDYIIMNPPYKRNLGFNITLDVLPFGEKVISLLPNTMITSRSDSKLFIGLKEQFAKHTIGLTPVSSKLFPDTLMKDLLVYEMVNNIVEPLEEFNGNDWENDIEKRICELLSSGNTLRYYNCMIESRNLNTTKGKTNKFDKFFEDNKDKWFMNMNQLNHAYYKENEFLFKDKARDVPVMNAKDEMEHRLNDPYLHFIIYNDSKEWLEGLKASLDRKLLKLAFLFVIDTYGSMVKCAFRYVPNIDYSKVTCDEDILIACGATPEEAKELMEYVNNLPFRRRR